MFPVHSVSRVEMIRDGGSLAATFEIEGPREFILFIPITQLMRAWGQPVLIDPAKRVTNALSGDSVPVPWDEAREVLNQMVAHVTGRERVELLRKMIEVAAHDGLPPASTDSSG